VEAAAEIFPKTDWQRCVVHFYRNVFSQVSNTKVAEVARMLIPGWPVCPDASRSQVAAYCLNLMGQASVPCDGSLAEFGKAGGGCSVTMLLLPGLRPRRPHVGFAATREESMDRNSR
jgi:hypothetical protein